MEHPCDEYMPLPRFSWYSPHVPTLSPVREKTATRHKVIVRVTHWLTVVAFLTLLITGMEIVISHPRFYWGEIGNVNTTPAFTLPIPASRDTVPTAYKYVMPDQNGWSRYLHFEAAWVLVLTAVVYGAWGLVSGHFRGNIVPVRGERSWGAIWARFAKYLRREAGGKEEEKSYNVLQRVTYLVVIFVLFPLIIWTGLAMSPSFTGASPATAWLLGGRQTARTLHFFLSWALVVFLVVHVVMIAISGFWSRMRAMTIGRASKKEERI
jgi:thiosulfate reductase cytochrome b subunit